MVDFVNKIIRTPKDKAIQKVKREREQTVSFGALKVRNLFSRTELHFALLGT